jgi:eukaryotic-like serine/threonine-protein kinase
MADHAAREETGAMFVAELTPGTTVGRYTVERDLSTGGMGHVYLAHDAAGIPVVLKFPHLSMIGDPALYDRYQRELEIGRTLRHPRIQHVLDSGEYEGKPYMVTAYVEGEPLRAYLSAHAPLPAAEALHILDELCQGVAYCHDHGVYHRDLKPENVLITPAGDVTIIDFGIALLRGARRITWAGLSTTVGTPDYMAPEQIQGKRGDARTDIYSLGAIGYELLCGQPPYSGDNPLAVMSQHLYGTLRPLSEVNPAVPPTLDAVIQKALRRNPDERYQSVEELRRALLSYPDSSVPDTAPSERRPLLAGHPQLRQALVRTLGIVAIIMCIVLLGVLAQLAHGGH